MLEIDKSAAILPKYLARGARNFSGTNTAKFLKGTRKAQREGGLKGAVNYLASHKSPDRMMPLGNIAKKTRVADLQNVESSIPRGIRSSIGNTASVFQQLGKDVGGKGVVGGAAQAAKNIGKTVHRQVRSDRFSEVVGRPNAVRTRRGGKEYIKSRVPFFGEREIVSETSRNTPIVRKRLAPLSMALGTSGASLGGLSYAFGDREQGQRKRIGNAAVDAGLFTVSPPVGIASAFLRTPKNKQKAKQQQF